VSEFRAEQVFTVIFDPLEKLRPSWRLARALNLTRHEHQSHQTARDPAPIFIADYAAAKMYVSCHFRRDYMQKLN